MGFNSGFKGLMHSQVYLQKTTIRINIGEENKNSFKLKIIHFPCSKRRKKYILTAALQLGTVIYEYKYAVNLQHVSASAAIFRQVFNK